MLATGTTSSPAPARWRPLAGAAVGLVVLPEVGVPMLYLALRLLATKYAWAAGADQWCRRQLRQAGRVWRTRPRSMRVLGYGLAGLGVAGLLAWTMVEIVTRFGMVG